MHVYTMTQLLLKSPEDLLNQLDIIEQIRILTTKYEHELKKMCRTMSNEVHQCSQIHKLIMQFESDPIGRVIHQTYLDKLKDKFANFKFTFSIEVLNKHKESYQLELHKIVDKL